MLPAPYADFYRDVQEVVSKTNIYTDPLRVLAYGTDASFYRLIPKMVIDTNTEEEVVHILKLAARYRIPVTFRAAGTSLSGQAVSDSVLVRLGTGWRRFRIFGDATRISLQPGIIGTHANRLLAEFGKKIGPDPASIDTAKIGGIVANNASGMCCGVAENSYKTLDKMRLVFYDGTLLDTSDDKSRAEFARKHPTILERVRLLRQEVVANSALADLISKKFKIKNTTGYSLNALVDFDDPFEIIQHLMVGSEGSLGFISEVTYRTVVEHPNKASALVFFPDIKSACEATIILRDTPVSAVELMDDRSLRSVAGKPGMPESLMGEVADGTTALLVESRAGTREQLLTQLDTITTAIAHIPKLGDVAFTEVPEEFGKMWAVRKGLFPAVGAVRKVGTTVIIEDVAFPIQDLATATLRLQELLKKYEYTEAIIFGHALDGNLHFVFTQNFSEPREIVRYQGFMDEVCKMVAHEYKGSLKAEHGTGRNMAPFVEMEWGAEAYRLMREIKATFDPFGLLNPGVIINEDAEAHLHNLKPLPAANSIVDTCIECGFCEPVCPSRNVTFTPRQRITAWREISRMKASDEKDKLLKKLFSDYGYFGDNTCATDGLCATRCPVGINTGTFIKHLRGELASPRQQKAATWVAEHFSAVAKTLATTLKGVSLAHSLFGTRVMDAGSQTLRVLTLKKMPLWNKEMPKGLSPVKPVPVNQANPLKVVYFPSCISRTMGPSASDTERTELPRKTVALLLKAGYEVIFPETLSDLCCGQAFESKGFHAQADMKSKQLSEALLKASNNGEYPVLSDTSPCLYRMKETLDKRLTLLEPIEFALSHLAERLAFTKVPRTIAIHTTCTSRKLGLDGKFKQLAELCAETVVVPEDVFCCGFAGDRGFSYPELNKSALAELKAQVEHCDEGYSTSRTCEIGLALHGTIPYRNIIYLLDEASRPKEQ